MKNYCIFFAIMVFLILTPAAFSESEAENEADIVTTQLEELKKESVEIISLRTENSKTFQQPDGKKSIFLSTVPLNYQGEDGLFYEIATDIEVQEQTFVLQTNTFGTRTAGLISGGRNLNPEIFPYRALKNTIKAYFPAESDGGLLLQHEEVLLFFSLKHENKREAKVEKNRIKYERVFANGDLQYTVFPGEVKEEVIFYSPPETPVLSYKVELDGLRYQNGENGSIDLIDEHGNTVFSIKQAVMYEQDNLENYKLIDTRFHWQDGELYCDLILDMAWLKKKDRKYPVVVDPTITVEGLSTARMLFLCPETNDELSLECYIRIKGPGYHGLLYDNRKAYAHFQDLNGNGEKFLSYYGFYDYEDTYTVNPVADHRYEVEINGGRATPHIFGHTYRGEATAVLTYSEPLFSNTSEKKKFEQSLNVGGIEDYVIRRKFNIEYPQTITVSYIKEFSQENNNLPVRTENFLRIMGPYDINIEWTEPCSNQEIDLVPGEYTAEISPKERGYGWFLLSLSSLYHYRVEINIPYLTANYESRICLGTNPGYIETTIKAPRNSELFIQYNAEKNGTPSSIKMPSVQIYEGGDSLQEKLRRNFDLIKYDYICGGEKCNIKKETPYRIRISRGRNDFAGWGSLSVNLYIQRNTSGANVSNLCLVDPLGNVRSGFAREDYRLRFSYDDKDYNTLKEYKLCVKKTGETAYKYYHIKDVNAGNGDIIVPYTINNLIKNLGYKNGDQVTCQIVEAWDGFDKYQSSQCSFIIDNAPPVISEFSAEVGQDNIISVKFRADDNLSGLKSRILSWKVDGEDKKTYQMSTGENTYTIENLSYNQKVEITAQAVDNLDIVQTQQICCYTYPEKSKLVEPKKIYGSVVDNYQADLFLEKVRASAYRIQRYRGEVTKENLEYDTGYLDTGSMELLTEGLPSTFIIENQDTSNIANHYYMYFPTTSAPGTYICPSESSHYFNSLSDIAYYNYPITIEYQFHIVSYIAAILSRPYFLIYHYDGNGNLLSTYKHDKIGNTHTGSLCLKQGEYIKLEFYTGRWTTVLQRGYTGVAQITYKTMIETGLQTTDLQAQLATGQLDPEFTVMGETVTGLSGDENAYYIIRDQPAQAHQTYIYRIWTTNGDREKEVSHTSDPVPVENNVPVISAVEPSPDTMVYSKGQVSIRVDAADGDNDRLRFKYILSGESIEGEPIKLEYDGIDERQHSFGTAESPLPDGNYTWAVEVKDDFGGTASVSGEVKVDKTIPTACFTINNGESYTNSRTVQIFISETSSNVNRIRISNSSDGPWQEYSSWSGSITWTLPDEDGVKTIYLQACSHAHPEWGPSVSKNITLDRSEPDVTGLRIFSQGAEQAVFFSWHGAQDATSGVAGYNIQKWEDGLWIDHQSGFYGNAIEISDSGYNSEIKMRIQAVDKLGNASDWVEASGFTKAAPGSIDLARTVSGFSIDDGHYIDLYLNEAEGAVRYRIECTDNPGGGYSGEISPGLYRDTGLLPHEEYRYKIYTYNSAGEVTESDEFTVEIANNFIATPVGTGPKGYINKTEAMTFAFDRPLDSDVDGDTLSVTYFVKAEGEESYTQLETGILEGLVNGATYEWFARITDGHGGFAETLPVSFTVDTTPPAIYADNDSTQFSLKHEVRITVSDEISGIESLQYSLNGAPLVNATEEMTIEITIDSHGANSLYVLAVDRAGNKNIFSHVYNVDREPPVAGNIELDLPEENGVYLATDSQIPVQWTADDRECGIAEFSYAWSTSNWGVSPENFQKIAFPDQHGTYHHIFSGDFEDGKTYYLHLQPWNNLGLSGNTIVSPPVLFDHTAPVGTIDLTGGRYFGGQYYITGLSLLGVETKIDDSDTGIKRFEYALLDNPNYEDEVWYNSLKDLAVSQQVNHGEFYYLAVRATNRAGLSTTKISTRIFIEKTSPELIVTAPAEQASTNKYTAHIEVDDPETGVERLEYSIGTTPGGTDLSRALPDANEEGWITVNYPAKTIELTQYGQISVGMVYYVTVKAYNIAGLVSTATSDGTKVVGPSKIAPAVEDDGVYTAENSRLHFQWSFAASQKAIEEYEYRLRSNSQVIKEWTRVPAQQEKVIIEGLALQNNTVYYCDVRAIYEDGSYSEIGSSDGILVDYTPPGIYEFTTPVYADGTGITVFWEAKDEESGVKCFLGVGSSPGDYSLTRGLISVGNLKSYHIREDATSNSIEWENGRSYYVTLLVENGSGLVAQKTSLPVLVDLIPPPAPLVLDEGNYTNRTDRLKANWKWTGDDPESGICEYFYTVTTERAIRGGELWFSNGKEKDVEITGLALLHGETYYIAVKAVNNAGLESINFSDGILVDTTAPNPPVAVDFGDYSLARDSLKVQVIASDAESGIDRYVLSMGTLEDPDAVFSDVEILANGGIETIELNNLSLEDGEIYFFTVTAINNAELKSYKVTSDGIMVDATPPEVKRVSVHRDYITDNSQLSFEWEAAPSASGIAYAQYSISTDPNGVNLDWHDMDLTGAKTVNGFELDQSAIYYVYVRVQNRAQAENAPDLWSKPGKAGPVVVDTTPPEIIAVSITGNRYFGQHFELQWEAWDDVSGIVEHRYAVGRTRGGTDLTGGWVTLQTPETTVKIYRDDLPLADGREYYISIMAKNGAGLWSEIYKTDAIYADLTPPVITRLEYDSNYLTSLKSISEIRWEAGDPQTGIIAYKVDLVKEKDGRALTTSVIPTDKTSGEINLFGLNLIDGGIYYIALQVQNGVKAWSEVMYSHGIKVDVTPPVVEVIGSAELVTNTGELEVVWRCSEPSIVQIQLLSPFGETIMEETIETAEEQEERVFAFAQELEGRYILSFIPTDRPGWTGEKVEQIIRHNIKPYANIGPDLTVRKGEPVVFYPEIRDDDGEVVEFRWDFGNGATSQEENPACKYTELGTYTVTLQVRDNDGKWSEPDQCEVTVTNTTSGELHMDEEWEDEISITGNVIVPENVTLTVKSGAKIEFSGNYSIEVKGKIVIDGLAEKPVTIDGTEQWDGIRLNNADPTSRIQNAIISNASVGLVLYMSDAEIISTTFRNNRFGMHVIDCCPSIKNCIFAENLIYGVKEDAAAAPTVIGCSFTSNGVADYYEDTLGIISITRLNDLGNNEGNTN